MQDQLVSIIMPMHNSAGFVGDAIESVIAQTYKSWELIVVDDNSTDDSVEIVKRYGGKDSRIRLLHNDRHIKMPSAPRNYGIRHAKGQYIAFLDSDDRWLPDKLERQLKLFDNKKIAVVFSDYEKIDEQGRRNNRIVKAPLKVTYKDLLHSNYIGNLTGIYDRKLTGTSFMPDTHHEDYALWLSILKKGFVARNTGTVEGLYRVRKSSVSSDKYRLLTWQWDIYRKHEHVSVIKSIYYYLCYAYHGYKKSKI